MLIYRHERLTFPGWEANFLLQQKVLVAQSCQTLCSPWTIARQATLSMEFPRQEYWSGQPFPSPGYLPNPGIEHRSPTLQADSFPAEPQGKPKNIGVGSLSLPQKIFTTQELNWGLLHCRWILYQVSCQGSPFLLPCVLNLFIYLSTYINKFKKWDDKTKN